MAPKVKVRVMLKVRVSHKVKISSRVKVSLKVKVSHTPQDLSWTKTNHLAKVSGP